MRRKKKFIDIAEIEKYYTIEEDGMIWYKKKNTYLKPTPSYEGYLYVKLSYNKLHESFSVHRLVAAKYIGQCPPELETSHKDGNKHNNHYTNLEYITHSENIQKSYTEQGRVHPIGNKHPPSVETKLKMANAKKKPIVFVSIDNERTIFPSVQDAATAINHTRATIWLCIHGGYPVFNKKRKIIGFLSYLNNVEHTSS